MSRPNGMSAVVFDQREEDNEFNNVVMGTDTMYTHGRPDWSMVLNTINDGNNEPDKTLVFTCGPMSMVKEVEAVAGRKGARFYSELFVM